MAAEAKAAAEAASKAAAIKAAAAADKPAGDAKLIDAEKREAGAVGWALYGRLFRQAGVVLGIAVVLTVALSTAANLAGSWWLSQWISAARGGDVVNPTVRRRRLSSSSPHSSLAAVARQLPLHLHRHHGGRSHSRLSRRRHHDFLLAQCFA